MGTYVGALPGGESDTMDRAYNGERTVECIYMMFDITRVPGQLCHLAIRKFHHILELVGLKILSQEW